MRKVYLGKREEERCSFLKKRTKKTFVCSGARVAGESGPIGKSFLVLFFKKEHSFFLLPGVASWP
jgi:hypothetical protein